MQSPNNSKFLAACISTTNGEHFSATDDSKAIYVWRRGSDYPLLLLFISN